MLAPNRTKIPLQMMNRRSRTGLAATLERFSENAVKVSSLVILLNIQF